LVTFPDLGPCEDTMAPELNNLYLIYMRPRESHSYMDLVPAPSPLLAIESYLQWQNDVEVHPDHSVSIRYGRKIIFYPHPLAAVEAGDKVFGEWQIRKVSPEVWATDEPVEFFLGEHPDEVESQIALCRPYLRADHPRSRASAFVWYLKQGSLVTYYRRAGELQIEVLGRFHIGVLPYPRVLRWHGDYQDLLDSLRLEPTVGLAGEEE
jgi:hypothetical protein